MKLALGCESLDDIAGRIKELMNMKVA